MTRRNASPLPAYMIAIAATMAAAGCPKPAPDPGPVSGFTDADPPPPPPATTEPADPPEPHPVLDCPGDLQCPCSGGCAPGQLCGPTGACTRACTAEAQCLSGVSGEICVATAGGGLCGVPCDPTTDDGGCTPAGMPGGRCVTLGPGDHWCGY